MQPIPSHIAHVFLFQCLDKDLSTLVEEKILSVVGDRATREYLENTIQDLREQLDQKNSALSPNWQQDTVDLLAEIQRECNAAFRRGKSRQKSPRNVTDYPKGSNPGLEINDDMLQEFMTKENWDLSDSCEASLPVSLPLLDQSLNELADTEALIRDL